MYYNSTEHLTYTEILVHIFDILIFRSSHNELEKNRRAHLRGCLENLKVNELFILTLT